MSAHRLHVLQWREQALERRNQSTSIGHLSLPARQLDRIAAFWTLQMCVFQCLSRISTKTIAERNSSREGHSDTTSARSGGLAMNGNRKMKSAPRRPLSRMGPSPVRRGCDLERRGPASFSLAAFRGFESRGPPSFPACFIFSNLLCLQQLVVIRSRLPPHLTLPDPHSAPATSF
jgi:hypothetical protein